MYWADYHLHTHFSSDSHESLLAYIVQAQKSGIDELCFTDHFDCVYPGEHLDSWACDVAGVLAAIDALPQSNIIIKKGIEMGIRQEEGAAQKQMDALAGFDFDFVIASVHMIDKMDTYFPEYFAGKTKHQSFGQYIRTIYNCIKALDQSCYSAVGHIDFPSKGCPYPDAALHYEDAPEELDELFRFVIAQGKCIEMNTSILRRENARPRDVNVWKRYVQLGGEYVTMGSDSHSADCLGYEFDSARAFLKEAGIKYFATFDQMKPQMHTL